MNLGWDTIRKFATYAMRSATAGFTLTGGGKVLTVDESVALSSKAPKASPVFTGDVTLSGNVTNATLPAFLVYRNAAADDVTGDSTNYIIPFDTEIYDQGNDVTTGVFTAPVTGKYNLYAGCRYYGLTADHNDQRLALGILGTSARTYNSANPNFGVGANPFTATHLAINIPVLMTLGDTATVGLAVNGGNKVVDLDVGVAMGVYFGGYLVC